MVRRGRSKSGEEREVKEWGGERAKSGEGGGQRVVRGEGSLQQIDLQAPLCGYQKLSQQILVVFLFYFSTPVLSQCLPFKF